MATLTEILQRTSPNKLKVVTVQTESAFSDESTAEAKNSETRSRKEDPGYLASRAKDASVRGVRVLIKILVETIHKEG